MPDRDIAIVTDSTSDIPVELREQYDIHMIPHTLVWGDQLLLDRVDIQPEEFYSRIQQGGKLPTTSQATEMQFLEVYKRLIMQGYKQIVVITVSNRLSGAIQSAINAARHLDFPVKVIDSLSVSMGSGWQVLMAARLRDLGGSVQQISSMLDQLRKTISLYVCMDTMTFLRHGGRIGDAVRLLGMTLNVKPVVRVNPIKGVVEEVGIARTYQKAVDIMYAKFFASLDATRKLHIAVLHGNAFARAEELVSRIQDEFHPVEIITSITGPALGLNTGPNALALAGYTEDS